MQKNIKKYMLVLLAVLLGALLTVCAIPVAQWLSIPENRSLVWQKIDALGPWGAVIFLVIQILQVVIAFIPGEPVELAAGLLYGTWGGLLICLTGILLGSSMIFAVVRRFGRPLVQRLVDEGVHPEICLPHRCPQAGHPDFPDVPDPRHPKDALNYLCPLTSISPVRFLVLSTFARIPSVISSTFAGANFAEGDLLASVIVLGITSAVGLLGHPLRTCAHRLPQPLGCPVPGADEQRKTSVIFILLLN